MSFHNSNCDLIRPSLDALNTTISSITTLQATDQTLLDELAALETVVYGSPTSVSVALSGNTAVGISNGIFNINSVAPGSYLLFVNAQVITTDAAGAASDGIVQSITTTIWNPTYGTQIASAVMLDQASDQVNFQTATVTPTFYFRLTNTSQVRLTMMANIRGGSYWRAQNVTCYLRKIDTYPSLF